VLSQRLSPSLAIDTHLAEAQSSRSAWKGRRVQSLETPPTALHQLGTFVVYFQHVEAAINELIALLSEADEDVVEILIDSLGYAERVRTADALVARIERIAGRPEGEWRKEFHSLCERLNKLGSRRNHFVHSRWFHWTNVEGNIGLLRRNARVRRRSAAVEETEEELQPEAFEADLKELTSVLQQLGAFRLQVLDRKYGPS
jgi:hypothetical protein